MSKRRHLTSLVPGGARRIALLMCAIVTALAGGSAAQTPPAQQPETVNPPPARILRPPPRQMMLTAPAPADQPADRPADQQTPAKPPDAAAVPTPPLGREAQVTLRITYTDTGIWNPGVGRFDNVHLRSYVNDDAPAAGAPLVAPTLDVLPGETIRLTLRNQLPREPNCQTTDPNVPHCLNTTNMHAHGLSVSPAGNSDNVLISIMPQVDFQYEYNIPADHPAGTFWYHPHRHGATAAQVGSGMAGALIIRGTRLPAPDLPGDIDTLLRKRDGASYPERVFLFQQIAYACRTASGEIKKNPDGTWLCEPNDVGMVENYDVFGLNVWRDSGRYTTINGRTAEPFQQRAIVGQPERWRMIHAGVRDTLRVSVRKKRAGAAPFARLAAKAQQAWIDANCEPAFLPVYEIAADGLTRAAVQRKSTVWLQPGYRSDTLVVFPTAGEYCVVDEASPPEQSVNGGGVGRQLLTIITAEGQVPGALEPLTADDPWPYLRGELARAAVLFMPASVRQQVIDDLATFKLTLFQGRHIDLRQTPFNRQRTLVFAFPPSIGNGDTPPRPYDPERIDRLMILDEVEEWQLQSQGGGHPFHIHINPFQIVRLQGVVNGKEVDRSSDPDSEYYGMLGVWKDTVFVQQGSTITMRTKLERYIGDFVLHCHILDHEDLGMMQNVRIAMPNGTGGPAPATHAGIRH